MTVNERSMSAVVQDIIGNFQEIVRSEVRLAKTEIRDEATKAKSAGILLGMGATMGIFAFLFLLLTILYALAITLPNWAAALIVAAVLAIIAVGTLSAGRASLKRVHATPERTVETLKENVEWMKQHTK